MFGEFVNLGLYSTVLVPSLCGGDSDIDCNNSIMKIF